MKTSVIEVRDMLSVLSVLGVEERIGEVPGVDSVTVNFAAGNATVRYDETRLDVGDIKSGVRQRGYEAEASAQDGGKGDAAPDAPGATSASDASKSRPVTSAAKDAPSEGATTPPMAMPAAADAADAVPAAAAGDAPQEKVAPDKS